jgi:DNA-binding CsgD family transcriptional regulator
MSDELTDHLRRLGLDAAQTLVYAQLLTTAPATPVQLTGATGLAAADVRPALEQLARAGLIRTLEDDSVVPLQPSVGVGRLALEREAELRAAQAAALNAYHAFRRTVWTQATDDVVEVVTGKPAIIPRSDLAESSATEEIRRFDTPPYHRPDATTNPIELENLGRGVRYRVVYARASVERREYYEENIRPCVSAGEQARVLPAVPVKMTIIDRRLALVSLPASEAAVNNAVLVVHPSSLLLALEGLFELAWRASFPMHVTESAPSPLRPAERRLLALLGAGLADENIAELLGVSRRTLTRRLEHLMSMAGTTNRFQLALHASRNGWL